MEERGRKLIAAFCSAINDEGGRREEKHLDGLGRMCCVALFFPSSHTSSTPLSPPPSARRSARSAYSQFLRSFSPSSSRSHSTTITTTTRATTAAMTIDPQTGRHQWGKILGTSRKRLRSLYTSQSAPFGRLLALEP